jgi:hypothetical protein
MQTIQLTVKTGSNFPRKKEHREQYKYENLYRKQSHSEDTNNIHHDRTSALLFPYLVFTAVIILSLSRLNSLVCILNKKKMSKKASSGVLFGAFNFYSSSHS